MISDRRRDSRFQTPLGSETPPWLKLPSGLEFASLLSALNRSPLSTSLPTPLRLCTQQSEAIFEHDRNETARLGIEKALEGLRVRSAHTNMDHTDSVRVLMSQGAKNILVASRSPRWIPSTATGTCSSRYLIRTFHSLIRSQKTIKYQVCVLPI
jgi:hypothetical protein